MGLFFQLFKIHKWASILFFICAIRMGSKFELMEYAHFLDLKKTIFFFQYIQICKADGLSIAHTDVWLFSWLFLFLDSLQFDSRNGISCGHSLLLPKAQRPKPNAQSPRHITQAQSPVYQLTSEMKAVWNALTIVSNRPVTRVDEDAAVVNVLVIVDEVAEVVIALVAVVLFPLMPLSLCLALLLSWSIHRLCSLLLRGTPALDPATRQFSDFTRFVTTHASQLTNTSHILMYCTGGVRCERASALLKTLGCKDVKQLHGESQGDNSWHVVGMIDDAWYHVWRLCVLYVCNVCGRCMLVLCMMSDVSDPWWAVKFMYILHMVTCMAFRWYRRVSRSIPRWWIISW